MLKTVQTENGLVRGITGNNARVTSFKGIPFAAPPVGDRRWKAPEPAESWEGVRDCFEFKPISVQDQPGVGTDIYCREWHVDPDIAINEDCLYLNVWTNSKTGDEKKPVLVWFFGGGFQWGYTAEMEFNGEHIAKRDVVVVSVNYRLGALGFLSHPELSKESPEAPANFGMLDQQAGLKWVIRNIAAFGGDPQNITIAGQSAGGGSVMNQLAAPSNKGLFQKAVIFSGMIRSPYVTKDPILASIDIKAAEKVGEKFFDFLGVKTLEEARKLDAFYIRDKYAEFRNQNGFMAPIVDGRFIPMDAYKSLTTGKSHNVPILAGCTEDEFHSFIMAENDADFEKQVSDIFGKDKDTFLSFPEAHVKNGRIYAPCMGIAASVKSGFRGRENCYYYCFEPDIPGWDHPGTFHSVDLWFWFETLAECWRPLDGHHFDLSRQMCNYLTNFIKNGDPNGEDVDGKMLPVWGAYSDEHPNEMHFTKNGSKPACGNTAFDQFLIDWVNHQAVNPDGEFVQNKNASVLPKKQGLNPYLPSWEYIPDGEPYVFGDRVYVYGSHDRYNGHAFCLNDYVCWSAPVYDLGNWRYEGVTYTRLDDKLNERNSMCLYAPDVTVGPDGRYYLYYVLDQVNVVSVAVCDQPAGKYEFYGYVHYEDGTRLGEKAGDEPQFDPGVITIGKETYLYTGFCGRFDKSRSGAQCTVLGEDMLTIKKAPKIIVPGSCYSEGTEFEHHAFFEAPSIRERNGIYYFIYSSEVMHELCYATGKSPEGPFKYGGVIVSNCDLGIDSYKAASKPTAYGANNHGSMVEINGQWYIFYHRQTNNSWYCRQGCAEPISFREDGSIIQAEITSCGLNGGPLRDTEEYPTYIACNLFTDKDMPYVGAPGIPRITMEGKDGDENLGFVTDMGKNATMGFKYFDFKGVKKVQIVARGYGSGDFEVRTAIDGPVLGKLTVEYSTKWEEYVADCAIPDGVSALYFTYVGGGSVAVKSFKFIH